MRIVLRANDPLVCSVPARVPRHRQEIALKGPWRDFDPDDSTFRAVDIFWWWSISRTRESYARQYGGSQPFMSHCISLLLPLQQSTTGLQLSVSARCRNPFAGEALNSSSAVRCNRLRFCDQRPFNQPMAISRQASSSPVSTATCPNTPSVLWQRTPLLTPLSRTRLDPKMKRKAEYRKQICKGLQESTKRPPLGAIWQLQLIEKLHLDRGHWGEEPLGRSSRHCAFPYASLSYMHRIEANLPLL